MPSPDEERSDKRHTRHLREGPRTGSPGRRFMVVRTRPSVHGKSLPQTLPNAKLLTKGRYELSSVKSSSTYPQYPCAIIVKSEKVGPNAQSGLAVCRGQSFRPGPRTRGARRGLATDAVSGSVAGEGWLTGLAGAVAVGVAGPQSVSLPSCLSESWSPPVAPCPMVLLSPPSALLPSSGVSVGMVSSAHSAAFEPLSPCLPRVASSST